MTASVAKLTVHGYTCARWRFLLAPAPFHDACRREKGEEEALVFCAFFSLKPRSGESFVYI